MKWTNLIIAILFSLFAYFQLNDPDPWRWVVFYGVIAALFLGATFSRFSFPLIYSAMAVAGIWMLTLFPDFLDWLNGGAESIVESMKAEKPHIELTREFLGLVIVIIALLYLRKQAINNKRVNG